MIKSENYDYATLTKTLNALCEEYPFLRSVSIGKSVVGRDIKAVKIGAGDKNVLIAAAFHGSEHITTNICLYLLEDIACSLRNSSEIEGINIKRILAKRGIIIVPRVNPDGCEISIRGAVACGEKANTISRLCRGNFSKWNSNFCGVDINHNFNADWERLRERELMAGIYGPSPTRYGGRRPESEPETKAVCELCRNIFISHALALHSQGEVIYHGFGDKNPRKSEKMAQLLATASGYALDVPMGLALGGGFKDWFICEFNRPAFTVEVGVGENPLPIETAESIYRNLRKMFVLSLAM